MKNIYSNIKNILDKVLAFIALIVLSPVMLGFAIAIKIESMKSFLTFLIVKDFLKALI